MTSARDVIAETKIAARLKIGMAPVDVLAPVGTHNAGTILAALGAAGYAVVPREPNEALRWSVVKHVPETELSADDLYRSFIRALTAAKETT